MFIGGGTSEVTQKELLVNDLLGCMNISEFSRVADLEAIKSCIVYKMLFAENGAHYWQNNVLLNELKTILAGEKERVPFIDFGVFLDRNNPRKDTISVTHCAKLVATFSYAEVQIALRNVLASYGIGRSRRGRFSDWLDGLRWK